MVGRQGKGFTRMNKWLVAILLLSTLSCESVVEESPIPDVPVQVEVNLNDIDNVALKQIGGYIYANGGVRGIIVLRESTTTYRAFDRNCTFQPTDACAIVSFHSSGFYMEDSCCGSTFDLSGFPTAGPAEFPLKEYKVSQSGDLLFITN